jgi:ABC-2 type transport system ATP-binding protein
MKGKGSAANAEAVDFAPGAALQPMIEVRNVHKRFGPVRAVDGISFAIGRGEVFGLLGPNGAGKTTTIRMLNGTLKPDTGQVVIDGRPLEAQAVRHKLRMGVVPELSNVYGDLSAFRNVYLTGKFYSFSKPQLKARTRELLQSFGLVERSDQAVRSFSKGMQQRVSLASVLVHDPEILFLDEPTSGLDVASQRLIKQIILERSRAGATVVLSTHNIEEASSLCDRVCILNRGRVVAVDSPGNLKKTCDSVQSVDVCFDRAVTVEELELDGLANRPQKMGDGWKLYTHDPDRLVKHLAGLAASRALSIRGLAIQQANLEDVFVALTEEGSNVY